MLTYAKYAARSAPCLSCNHLLKFQFSDSLEGGNLEILKENAKYAAVSGETVIVVLASLFALLRFAVSGGVEAFAGTSHDF